ncbi:MAG TPA: hypothetical protein VFE51_06080 [Verrucomicrobiae bacterium]|nr:hypothetical protein [Verrucomicrobiae bacterium]
MADKTVKGDTNGVTKDLIDFLDLVAKYGGSDIIIKQGGGFRSAKQEAGIVYRNWNGPLKRGAVFDKGSLPDSKRKELDEYYVTAKESKEASSDDKKEAESSFLETAMTIPSYHKVGKAVDLVDSSLTGPMKKVLEKYMQRVPEPGCYHVQYKGAFPKEDKIKEELGAD